MTLRLPMVATGPWRMEYPFASRFLELGPGRAIHYVDEGHGPPVVMVHGNPTWSFMYRHLIKNLAGYRRLALDHLGMGLSSRPEDGYGYTLGERQADFGRWIDSLNLAEPIHLIVHDWGGPVGLGWAGQNPDRLASVTIMNTGLARPRGFRLPARLTLFHGCRFLGGFLATDLNLFAKGVVRYGTVRPMSPTAIEGFLAPYRLAAHRRALPAFVADIPLGEKHPSHGALSEAGRNFARLAAKPTLIAWGLRDFVFSKPFLDDIRARRPQAEVTALPRAGHWLLEDEPGAILQAVSAFLGKAIGV
ncbi:MAG: alpha/beta fold hydrolase [Deltaproteobacteria bacterium]|jgi:haloalkane dehalogenase|nr:alpha/beta fold hydrolase [Deltaproteobacteria bacterium]